MHLPMISEEIYGIVLANADVIIITIYVITK